MGRDIISYVARNTKPLESDELIVLLVSTDGEKPAQLYRDLDMIRDSFPDVNGKASKIYRKAAQLFNQGKTTMARGLYRKVLIVGFAQPETPAALVDLIESFRQVNDEWNILLTDRDETEYAEALIAYAESTEPTLAELTAGVEDHRKLYIGQTTDKAFHFDRARGVMIWVHSTDEEADAAMVGNIAPFYPRRVTWKFKQPDGVTLGLLSEGEKSALDDQNVNYLTKEYGFIYMKNGVCTDGEFIDVLLGADYLAKRIRQKLYTLQTTTDDVPYTDNGFALVGAQVISALNDGVNNNIIALDPESGKGMFTVTIPTRANATEEQARARIMPDITWEATVEGSVHKAAVTGTLTVELITQTA